MRFNFRRPFRRFKRSRRYSRFNRTGMKKAGFMGISYSVWGILLVGAYFLVTPFKNMVNGIFKKKS